MTGRSYGQIVWRKKNLGLMMVNPHHQFFFLYAKPLLSLVAHPGTYRLVKKRDRNPEKAIYYHGGEIAAYLEERVEGEKDAYLLTLYFGAVEGRMSLDKERNEMTGAVDVQEYLFPREELDTLAGSISLMMKQKERFDQLMTMAETYPGDGIPEL